MTTTMLTALLSRIDRLGQQFAASEDFPAPKPRTFQGFKVAIENPVGSVRSGVDGDGKPWSIRMKNDYGFMRRVDGADGEGLDVYIGPDENAKNVYVAHQNDPTTGQYDEDKVMMGFPTDEAALSAYLAHYNRPGFYRSMTMMPVETFRQIAKTGGKMKWKRKPALAKAAMFSAGPQQFAAEHAPVGGVDIDGHPYLGGQFIPLMRDVLDAVTKAADATNKAYKGGDHAEAARLNRHAAKKNRELEALTRLHLKNNSFMPTVHPADAIKESADMHDQWAKQHEMFAKYA